MLLLEKMKISLLLFIATSVMIMTNAEEEHAKKRKDILEKLSNAISDGSTARTEKLKKIDKRFEWMIQCVNLLGQVDNFITDRTKNLVRKLHTIYNEDEGDAHRNSNLRKRSLNV